MFLKLGAVPVRCENRIYKLFSYLDIAIMVQA